MKSHLQLKFSCNHILRFPFLWTRSAKFARFEKVIERWLRWGFKRLEEYIALKGRAQFMSSKEYDKISVKKCGQTTQSQRFPQKFIKSLLNVIFDV